MDDATRERMNKLREQLAETQTRVMAQLQQTELDPRFIVGRELGRVGDAVVPHLNMSEGTANSFVSGVNKILAALPDGPSGCRCKEGKDKISARFNEWATKMQQRRGG
jgi:hypothetical protein